ncbi:beta-ketoacyl-[acyl-carrier-protein] synthase family protein [Micromonospora coxensis]|uniref:3-oxoacyl-[acyl-carrier-protein] synthase 2 n=1 Tax=Micromonospora coxensis TaxID=356852 RepID=A0A1C5K2G4_9ACTN|nr:beta-ketoacyl-ACP synthase II [Micromonospora coxensis]SCG76957.1 3-oxoacyl-[acyl-carrier-protein] synthase II [Micromonospora coxensis]
MDSGHPTRPEVVITGIGAVTPAGVGRETTWRNLLAGRSGVGPVTAFDTSAFPTRIAAEVIGFDPSDHLDARRVRRSARFSQFAVVAAREAIADAKLEIDADNAGRVGVVVNAAVAGFDTVETATRGLVALPQPVSPSSYFVPSSLTNMPACEVAIDLGVHGPVNASALACASGLYALLDARRLILAGEADAVVCGGTDAAITPVMFAGLSAMGAMSQRNDDPAAASRPFSADRDGFVFGEGAVLMVVESAEHAARRGVVPYATVSGGALTCDAFHVSAPSPDGAHATAAIGDALRRAEVHPCEVDYICAHGTSTQANDRTETRAIRAALGESAQRVAVSSPKSMVGHLIGAAGSLGAMVCAMAIREGVVPPTINLDVPDPQCDLDYVPHVARKLPVRVAAANAFGFGGQNCVVVFRAPKYSMPAQEGIR